VGSLRLVVAMSSRDPDTATCRATQLTWVRTCSILRASRGAYGPEWINSGSLMARINFVAGLVGDPSLPGVRAIIDRLKTKGTLSPEQLVDGVWTCWARWK